MKSYNNIAELIELLEVKKNKIAEEIATLQKEPRNFHEQIIFKYIDTGSTGKTKDYFRELNVMSERGTYFSSGDVSKLLKDGADDISPELLAIARKVNVLKKKSGSKR